MLIAALAIGAVQPAWTMVVCSLALAAGIVSWTFSASTERVPLPTMVCFGLAAYCLLQALPLPLPVVHALSPHGADVWTRALRPLRELPPGLITLSLDPGASLLEAYKWTAYGATFLAAAWLARRHGARTMIAAFFAITVLVAMIALLHALVGAEKYLGIYEPRFKTARFGLAPLLNPNNLAGYLNLGAFCGIGLVLIPRSPIPRWIVVLGLLPVLGISFLSASRGGLAALLVGAFAVSFLLKRDALRRHSHPSHQRASLLIPLGIVAGGVLLAGLGSTRQTWNELLSTSAEKLQLVAWAKPMLADFPVFGIGRGAFESAFPAYRARGGHVLYQFAENFLAQWVVEWGVPVTVLALVGFGLALRPSKLRMTDHPLPAAVGVGVFVLLAHNLVDLALEVPAVTLALAAVLGTLAGSAERAPRQIARPSAPVPVATATRRMMLPLAASMVLLVLVASRALTSVDADRHALQTDLLAAKRVPERLQAVSAELRKAILRHPADPFFPLLGALTARRTANVDPLPWLARSLERDPQNGRTHFILAQALADRGAADQALMAARLASERDVALAPHVARLAVRLGKQTDQWLRAVPRGPDGALVLVELARQIPAGDAARQRFIAEALARQPGLTAALAERARYTIEQLARPDAGKCAGKKETEECTRSALSDADQIAVHEPHSARGTELRARVLDVTGKSDDAEALLGENCGRFSNAAECWRLRAQIAAKLSDPARLSDALDSFVAASCGTREGCASAGLWAGQHLLQHGKPAAAVNYFARAAHEMPTKEAWLALAAAAQRAGMKERARAARLRAGASQDGEAVH